MEEAFYDVFPFEKQDYDEKICFVTQSRNDSFLTVAADDFAFYLMI